mgnify:CR=1 FL=1
MAAPLLRLTEEDDAVVAWQAAAALANLTVDCIAVKVGRLAQGSGWLRKGDRMVDATVMAGWWWAFSDRGWLVRRLWLGCGACD